MAIIGETTTSEKSQLNSQNNIVYHLMVVFFLQFIQSVLFKGEITTNEILTTEFINIQKEK